MKIGVSVIMFVFRQHIREHLVQHLEHVSRVKVKKASIIHENTIVRRGQFCMKKSNYAKPSEG
eukprot:867574-Amphidinium_carterae.1